MTDMCQHGFSYGNCPYGCKETTSEAGVPQFPEGSFEPPLPALEPHPIPPEFEEPKRDYHKTEDKLKCVICGEEVETGTVYKGKPICDSCMSGIKEKKEGEE